MDRSTNNGVPRGYSASQRHTYRGQCGYKGYGGKWNLPGKSCDENEEKGNKNINMKISIITSCYNRVATVRDAIRSVLAQDYADIEYIIVDGASTDGSVEAIQEAIAGKEGQVKFISEPDHGMYEAINKGIRMATGDYIGLVHSDDFLYS